MNMRKLDTVIKDGKIVDRDYHPWYKGWLFANSRDEEGGPVVEQAQWVAALKQATWRPNAGPTNLNIQGPAAPFPTVPDLWASPTPAIESIEPAHHHSRQSDADARDQGLQFRETFAGLCRRSSGPDAGRQPDGNTGHDRFADSGQCRQSRGGGEKSDCPLDPYAWGDSSNKAHILVPFSFTTAYSHNKY